MSEYTVIAQLRGKRGKQGPRGIPGAAAVPTADAVAAYIEAGAEDVDSLIAGALSQVSQWVITPQMFGAVGDGIADDTAAVQDAIDFALSQTDPIHVEKPVFEQARNGYVFFPLGTYKVDELHVDGTISMWGVGGGIYAASVLMQRTAGQSILRLKGDTDSVGSQATRIENLTFKSVSGTSQPTVAQIITDTEINSHSVYIRNCWFKTPERYAIWIKQGDDLQITDCTFDVSAFNFIRLGSAEGVVMNAGIRGCTFFEPAIDAIALENVRGITINGNRCYYLNVSSNNAWFVNFPSTGAVSIRGVSITGNDVRNIFGVLGLPTVARSVAVQGNALTNIRGALLGLSGGGIVYGLDWSGNPVANDAGIGFASGAAFSGAGCGLQFSSIEQVALGGDGTSTPLVFDLPDARVTDNYLNRVRAANFAAIHNLANAAANGF